MNYRITISSNNAIRANNIKFYFFKAFSRSDKSSAIFFA